MFSVWRMSKLESAFAAAGPGSRLADADLCAAAGLDHARLCPLLATMKYRGWIVAVRDEPLGQRRWALTERGWEDLSESVY